MNDGPAVEPKDGYACAIMTHARKRKQDAQEPLIKGNEAALSPIQDDGPDTATSSPDAGGESRRKRRRLQRGERIHRVLEPWTCEFLVQQQLTDPDLLSVRM